MRDATWCVGQTHRRYCELVGNDSAHALAYASRIVQRSAAGPRPAVVDPLKSRIAQARPLISVPPPIPSERRANVRDAPQGIAQALDPNTFVTEDQLLADTRILAAALPPDVDLAVGIVRSGMLVAPRIATWRHLPMRGVSQQAGVTNPGHGGRMVGRDHVEPRHVLLIDDTAATGREMARCLPLVRAAYPRAKVTTAVVYAHPIAAGAVDLFLRSYPGPHFLEWNWANAGHGERCGLDFDGILCRDFTSEECRSVDAYREAMLAIPPLYLPRRAPVPFVATARHESFRAETQAWLDRHEVNVQRLVMRAWGRPDDHAHDPHQVARWKSEFYAASTARLFAESDPDQAREIARRARKPVLCPAAGRVFPGPTQAETNALMQRVHQCPDRGCKTGCQHALCRRFQSEVHVSRCLACVAGEEDSPPT